MPVKITAPKTTLGRSLLLSSKQNGNVHLAGSSFSPFASAILAELDDDSRPRVLDPAQDCPLIEHAVARLLAAFPGCDVTVCVSQQAPDKLSVCATSLPSRAAARGQVDAAALTLTEVAK